MMALRPLCLPILVVAVAPALAGGEIFGTVYTSSGELRGPIRWDRNENFWDDRLDALKTEVVRKQDSGFKLSLFGLRIGGDPGGAGRAFSVPFGHLRSLESFGDDRARVILKNGERFDVRAGGSDLGRDLRNVEVFDAARGRVELSWDEIQRIEFSAATAPGPGRDAERLFGTVETEAGSFTGTIVWDRDESLAGDVLDGHDGKAERKVPIGQVRSIAPRRAGGSNVELEDGAKLVLAGTNDVDDGQRGVAISVAGLGAVDVPWRSVVRVTFADPPPSPSFESFDGGKPIRGTLRTVDGRSLAGAIAWDRDETHSWETLEGEANGLSYSIPFALVRSIESQPELGGVRVVMRDGRTLELAGSNDVGQGNRGVVVKTDTETTEIDWSSFQRLELD